MINFNIEFKISSFPNTNQLQYFIAYLEGNLKIWINKKLFFESSDVLIGELGIFFINWLEDINRKNIFDFHYNTMDSDENPLLSFKWNGKNGFFISSPWELFKMNEPIDKKILIDEVDIFINGLNEELKGNCKVNIYDLKI